MHKMFFYIITSVKYGGDGYNLRVFIHLSIITFLQNSQRSRHSGSEGASLPVTAAPFKPRLHVNRCNRFRSTVSLLFLVWSNSWRQSFCIQAGSLWNSVIWFELKKPHSFDLSGIFWVQSQLKRALMRSDECVKSM